MSKLSDKLRADAEAQLKTAAHLAWIVENVLPKHHLEEVDSINVHSSYADARVVLTAPDLAAGLTILERTDPCNIYEVHGSGIASFRPSHRVIDGTALNAGECADLCGPYLYHVDDYHNELQCFFEEGEITIDVRVRVLNDPLTYIKETVEYYPNTRKVLRKHVELVNTSGHFTRKIHWGGTDGKAYTLYLD